MAKWFSELQKHFYIRIKYEIKYSSVHKNINNKYNIVIKIS